MRNGSVVKGIESDKGRALLAYLATESGQPHRREALADLLWPDADQNRASQNLRRAIYNLRQALEGEFGEGSVLLVSRQDVQFNNAAGHRVDVTRVSAHLEATATHSHERIDACQSCIKQLKAAAELYRGDFLVGLSFLNSEPFELWRTQKQEELHTHMMEALTHVTSYHKRRREYGDIIRYLRYQIALESWREEAHLQLMEALALTGQTSAALRQYEVCRRILQDELGRNPSPEMVALYRYIQSGDVQVPAPQE
jgi:DNA-binding SARP family transcriptional activator